MTEQSTRELELDLLLEGLYRAYHYDFRAYARSSLRRRVDHALGLLGLPTITSLLDRCLHDPEVFSKLLLCLTIQVSTFFRDPSYWRILRERAIPYLSTYPFLRIWVAGCGAGEEAYSMAILLHEEGLLERAQIYATDIDATSLREAASGIFELDRARSFSKNYFAAGGRASFSDYYTTAYSGLAMVPILRERILFSDHSLATDAAFAEVQLVSCRNVLIYFDRGLQDRALNLFRSSLCRRGFLGLGTHESLQFAACAEDFESFDSKERIFRLKVETDAGSERPQPSDFPTARAKGERR